MRKAAEIAEAFAHRDRLDDYRSFFLVGIGGAGMSALARMLKHRGFEVRGTDSTRSSVTDELEQEGIPVRIGHTGEGLCEGQAVVLTDAIDLGASPEVDRARELGLDLFRRSQVLGWLLKGRKVIAVTGTHGKTTTTGMIGAGLRAAGLDPLIVVGAAVPEFGGPVVEGNGEWAVVEACEAYDSFHDLDPDIVVLTNLELDHVDYHGSWENLRESVVRFASRAEHMIYCAEDEGARDVSARSKGGQGYTSLDPQKRLTPLGIDGKIALPGDHNLLNAAGALVAAERAGAAAADAWSGIAGFRGAERRLQVLQEGAVTIIDDYAHHPTEIDASLRAVRDRYEGRRIIVVYQPHLYSRTEPLIKEFAEALSVADEVVLTDIYPAREDPIPGVSSARIAELVAKPVCYVPSRHLLPIQVGRLVREGDVVVGMGAGSIADFAPALMEELERRPPCPAAGGWKGPEGCRVAVLYGGDSAEREVSILSGRAVHGALLARGYTSRMVDATEVLLSKGDLSAFIGPDRPDVAFLAVHGTHAEDGAIQGLLELLHIPYTGSGIQASAIAMDKQLTKTILKDRGIRIPEGELLVRRDQLPTLKPPVVVKPNAQGSTVGLSFVETEDELPRAIERAFAYDDAVLVEEWVRGMEISVPVIGDRALPPVEICPQSGQYDFAAKYTPGATEEICPARLPEKTLREAERLALAAHQALGCRGATRTDMMVSDKGEIYVLEVNTLPGLTGTSLLPNSARAAGISFEDLVDWIVKDALERNAAKT